MTQGVVPSPARPGVPTVELGPSPGWLPTHDPQRTFTTALRDAGYWTAQISDNTLRHRLDLCLLQLLLDLWSILWATRK